MSALRIEAYVPEVHDFVEEARLKPGQKPVFIEQNIGSRGDPADCLYMLRCFPRSAFIERVRLVPGMIQKIGDKAYGFVPTNDEFELVANLKRGQQQVEFPILTTLDEPRLYRFTYEE